MTQTYTTPEPKSPTSEPSRSSTPSLPDTPLGILKAIQLVTDMERAWELPKGSMFLGTRNRALARKKALLILAFLKFGLSRTRIAQILQVDPSYPGRVAKRHKDLLNSDEFAQTESLLRCLRSPTTNPPQPSKPS